MNNKMTFSGFIDKNAKEHKAITIENKTNKPIFFNEYLPDLSYNSFSLKDTNELLVVEWEIHNNSYTEFLKNLISSNYYQNIVWNIKNENSQQIGVKDKDILDKIKINKGIFSVLIVDSNEMILFEKNLSSGVEKIKTFFINQNYSYIDLINHFEKEQKKKGFSLSVVKKRIVKIKTENIFDSKTFLMKPQYITTQTMKGAARETISGSFFVIKLPKENTYNILLPFSHVLAHNYYSEQNFNNNELRINSVHFLEAEDFYLCSVDAKIITGEEDPLFD